MFQPNLLNAFLGKIIYSWIFTGEKKRIQTLDWGPAAVSNSFAAEADGESDAPEGARDRRAI